MICTPLLGHKTKTGIRQQTQNEDIRCKIEESKQISADHEARLSDNRWTSRITVWLLRLFQRKRGPGLR